MIQKDIDQIKEEDLQALVANKVAERKTIEYKQALPGNSDKEKKRDSLRMFLLLPMPAVAILYMA